MKSVFINKNLKTIKLSYKVSAGNPKLSKGRLIIIDEKEYQHYGI